MADEELFIFEEVEYEEDQSEIEDIEDEEVEEEEESFEDEHVDKEAEKEFGNPLTKNFFEILEGVGGEEVAE